MGVSLSQVFCPIIFTFDQKWVLEDRTLSSLSFSRIVFVSFVNMYPGLKRSVKYGLELLKEQASPQSVYTYTLLGPFHGKTGSHVLNSSLGGVVRSLELKVTWLIL